RGRVIHTDGQRWDRAAALAKLSPRGNPCPRASSALCCEPQTPPNAPRPGMTDRKCTCTCSQLSGGGKKNVHGSQVCAFRLTLAYPCFDPYSSPWACWLAC